MFSCHIAGGTHHAFYDYGEGFCVFSDIAVAANLALLEYPNIVRKIVIIDLDVHQGNGNAVLFKDDSRVFTFSMHCKENYFSKKQSSDVDVELDAGTTDEEYLLKLQAWLPYLTKTLQPDLIFYQAGVDISGKDRLGRLSITRDGLRRRNRMVYKAAKRHGVRIVTTMGGG
jgi:acetoin utilization deacetylase AcuC-like enzyme